MIFACCGARHCVPRHRLPSPRTSWPGLSAGISRNRLSGSLIRKPPRFWSLAQGDRRGADRPRRLRSGTVIVREYQGDRHTVTVVPGGYVWRDATYASLSAIACNITGTAWNGPRFFGLRAGGNRSEVIEGEQAGSHAGIAAVGRLHRNSVSPPRTKVRR